VENKKQILTRSYIIYVGMCVFALGIFYRICIIQFSQGEMWKQKAEAMTTQLLTIEGVRGNIFDVNGALLATSVPYYEVAIDACVSGVDDKMFKEKRDSLALCFSNLFGDKSQQEYSKILRKARADKDRYVVIQRGVSYKDLQQIKKFPLLRKGSRGGLITMQTNKRERPFQWLAARTIGLSREGIKPVGLEGAYDSVLLGTPGKRLMQKIAGGIWRPINSENEVEPKDGSDLYTTLDINIQDVAENALMKALKKNHASHGCAVLMEVRTGAIKAIANLSRSGSDSNYYESLNQALIDANEPGSTFKLASFLAAIDDYNVSLDEKIFVGNGEVTYYNKTIKDAHPPKTSTLTLQQIFETSSNCGTAKMIMKYYQKNPQQFVNKIRSFHIDRKLGICIQGEASPFVKDVNHKDWSGLTLPQMSYGYETLLTPLMTLSLYNAIANDGKMVRPQFVREIRKKNTVLKKFDTEVIAEQIVKKETVAKAKILMEGVVQNGSGKGLNITAFKVGGKTGTAQIAKMGARKGSGKTAYGDVGDRTYQASFVGYFPAERPLYTCIVVINSPNNGVYYGGLVAGPVFKEIAEKVYSGSVDFLEPINSKNDLLTKAPDVITTRSDEVKKVAAAFSIPAKTPDSNLYISQNKKDSTRIAVYENSIESQLKKGIMPNLTGLSAKDALYLLENHGLYVRMTGFGSVKKQSIEAGQRIMKGNKVTLTLI
jgi:cell division protein FtsI (penicillin-binding protein 3)